MDEKGQKGPKRLGLFKPFQYGKLLKVSNDIGRIMQFLDPESYELCPTCTKILKDITAVFDEGPDTDDNEAPMMWMSDHGLFCGTGGYECREAGTHLYPPDPILTELAKGEIEHG